MVRTGPPTAARFQLRGTILDDRPGHENLVWELHARYAQPYDDTTVLNVFHRALDGGVSVLLDRYEFHGLAASLQDERGTFEVRSGQTTARLTWTRNGMETRIWWNGSLRTREIILDADQLQTVRATMANMDASGWAGWRAGVNGGWERYRTA